MQHGVFVVFEAELQGVCEDRAILVSPDGYATLDVGPAPAVVDRFARLDRRLKAA